MATLRLLLVFVALLVFLAQVRMGSLFYMYISVSFSLTIWVLCIFMQISSDFNIEGEEMPFVSQAVHEIHALYFYFYFVFGKRFWLLCIVTGEVCMWFSGGRERWKQKADARHRWGFLLSLLFSPKRRRLAVYLT